jgi:hypothetical protein
VKYGEGEAEVEGEQGPVRVEIVLKEREGQQMIHSLKIPEPAGISMSKKMVMNRLRCGWMVGCSKECRVIMNERLRDT